jgi:hypothetical protein
VAFQKRIARHQRLFLRIKDQSKPYSASFDLREFDKVAGRMEELCGWAAADLTYQDFAQLQTALKKSGHYAGAVDGEWGPGSRGALLKYQRANALPATGILNKATLEHLGWKPKAKP